MATLGTILASMAGPLAKKVLSSIGVGVISYVAISAAMSAAQAQVISAWGGMTASLLSIISLAGGGTAVGIILGAFTASLTFQSLSKLGVLKT